MDKIRKYFVRILALIARLFLLLSLVPLKIMLKFMKDED